MLVASSSKFNSIILRTIAASLTRRQVLITICLQLDRVLSCLYLCCINKIRDLFVKAL